MNRHFRFAIQLLSCAGLVAAAPAQAEPIGSAGPLCFYQGRSFSEGAFVCVQKSLMLNCATEGPRGIWRVVVDRELSERCVAPTALHYSPARHRHAHRTHLARRTIVPARDVSAKCFSFNGKQYCE